MFDVFRGQGEKIAGYSGPVAAAQAMSDVRQEMATIKRANRIGPDVARWETTGGKTDAAFDRMGTELLKAAMSILEPVRQLTEASLPVLNMITKAIELGTPAAEAVIKAQAWVLEHVVPGGTAIMGILRKILDAVKKDEEPEEGEDPFLTAFLASGRDGQIANMPNLPAVGVGP
jgi:hypothetical protein